MGPSNVSVKKRERLRGAKRAINLEDFARRLQALLLERGLTRSDLARSIYGSQTDSRGFTGAKGRDRVGAWVSGKAFPDRAHLMNLCEALGVSEAYLAGSAFKEEKPSFGPPGDVNIHESKNSPGKALLQINMVVDADDAAYVYAYLKGVIPKQTKPGAVAGRLKDKEHKPATGGRRAI